MVIEKGVGNFCIEQMLNCWIGSLLVIHMSVLLDGSESGSKTNLFEVCIWVVGDLGSQIWFLKNLKIGIWNNFLIILKADLFPNSSFLFFRNKIWDPLVPGFGGLGFEIRIWPFQRQDVKRLKQDCGQNAVWFEPARMSVELRPCFRE